MWKFASILLIAWCSALPVIRARAQSQPPTAAVEATVIAAFTETYDGWSVDEVLLNDDRRAAFLRACFAKRSLVLETDGEAPPVQPPVKEGLPGEIGEDEYCEALLHVRKAGSRLPRSQRRSNERASDADLVAAEIAARQLQDELDCHTDKILVNAVARAKFDEFAKSLAPNSEPYLLRKAAVQLRKARRLEPELVSRVTDWRRTIREAPLGELRATLDAVSDGPGVYIFRDATGYLYIGQAANLRERMKQHLLESDRVALAKYIASSDPQSIQIELHEFESSSPASNTRTRRAYESELIRTRKPRLNLAP